MAKSSTPGRTKGQESAETLMTAAVDLFAARDYTSVTIQDITKHAGVAHSLIYYHFKSKDDLFEKAVNNLIDTTIKKYQDNLSHHENPVVLLEHWFDNNIQFSTVLKKLTKIMFLYSRPEQATESVTEAIQHFMREEHNIIQGSISQGIEEGFFRKVDPKLMTDFVQTHIDGIFYDSFIRNTDDIKKPMADLKQILWTLLDYKPTDKNQVASG